MRPRDVKTSNGSTGERLAEHAFNFMGWIMFRHQPATRVIKVKGNPVIINVGNGGVPDYSGYRMMGFSEGRDRPEYLACEVKEATGDSMPCSRLSKDQRAFMKNIPIGSAWVCIAWMDGSIHSEIHPFKEKGSYKRQSI